MSRIKEWQAAVADIAEDAKNFREGGCCGGELDPTVFGPIGKTFTVFAKSTPFEQVGEFHQAFGHPIFTNSNKEVIPSADTIKLRLKLITEELEELIEACVGTDELKDKFSYIFTKLNSNIEDIKDEDVNFDLVEVADALGDINYVVNGAAHTFNFDLDAVTTEIHRSNMSKLGPDGKPIYREDGKVLKGPNYFKPNLKPVLGIPESIKE